MLEKYICPNFCITLRHYLMFITLEIQHSNMYVSMLLIARYPLRPTSHHLKTAENILTPLLPTLYSDFEAQMGAYFVTISIKVAMYL